jgi:hypothetical protein
MNPNMRVSIAQKAAALNASRPEVLVNVYLKVMFVSNRFGVPLGEASRLQGVLLVSSKRALDD